MTRRQAGRDRTPAPPRGRRGVSVTVNYALNLAIATMLVSGLLFAVGNTVQNRQEATIRAELEVVGQRLAADLQAADRMARAGGNDSRVRIETPLPATAATTNYRIALNTTASPAVIHLTTSDPRVEVTVRVWTATPIADSEIPGGDAVVVFDGSTLEVVRE